MAETIASGTTVSNISLGTEQILDVYGVGINITVGLVAEVNVYSKGTVDHVYLKSPNAIEYVFAGGVNNFGTLSNGEMVIEGGVDSGSVINGTADEYLENGGISYNLLEASPAATSFKGGENIYSGSEAFNTTIENYFNQNVNSGGSAIDTTVDSGGALGGNEDSTIQSAVINSGGILDTYGLAQNVILGGTASIEFGGVGTNMLVNSGGTLTIGSLGSAAFTTVMSGGFEFLSGGSATGTQLEGGFESVRSGGLDQAATVNSGSRLGVDSGGMANLTAIKNGGYEGVLSGGTASNVGISLGGTLEVDSGGTVSGTINLGGTLIIDDFSDMATVSFGNTGELVLGYMYFYPGGTARITNDTLTISDNGTIFTQALTGNYSDYTPVIEDVSLYGVDVVGVILKSNTAPCFAAGSRILTPRGEIAIENLVIGDIVITKDGEDAPIKWIGKRKLELSRHPHPEQAQPILIEAGCLADGVPSSDLILSPDHALYLDGVLVPAKALVNGETIRQLNRQTVTYYHIELEKHSIIFAENTPVETYLETGNRGAFENGTDALTLHPDLAQTMREEQSCAPFVETGPVVLAIRIRTLERQYSMYKSGPRRYLA